MTEEKSKESAGFDLTQVKTLIAGELQSFGYTNQDMPEIFPEKKEIHIQFSVQTLEKAHILEAMQILKSHLDGLKLHTFEEGYYCIQTLPENPIERQSIFDQMKFRFIVSRSGSKVEMSKRGNVTAEEVHSVVALFRFLKGNSSGAESDPKAVLEKLGADVFDPIEAEVKGELWSFDWIAGYEGVKQDIKESILLPLQNPEAFDQIASMTRKHPSGNRPRAVLFEGDPGVGKTTMAKVVSCLAKVPLIHVPVESILSKFYGESAQNMSYVFDLASMFPSSLLFLDEIDSLAGSRNDGMFEASRKVLSVLLRKLDGFESKKRSVLIGATNRKQDLDPALLSRFDRSIFFPLPNQMELTAILENYAYHLSETQRKEVAKGLQGLSGRSVKDFCQRVERIWVTQLIEKGLKIEPPRFEMYKEESEKMANSGA